MKLTIVTTVLLGLLLTPTLADTDWNTEGKQHSNGNHQVINEPVLSNPMLTKQTIRKQIKVNGHYQTLTLEKERLIAMIQQESTQGSWKTIWNYNTGTIASKVLPERVCYISKVIKTELPNFEELPRLAEETMLDAGHFVYENLVRDRIKGFAEIQENDIDWFSLVDQNLKSQSQPAEEISFVTETRIHNLRSYGPDIFALCRGIPTYLAYKVNGPQNPHNQGSCVTLDVLKLLGLQYCRQLHQNVKQEPVSN